MGHPLQDVRVLVLRPEHQSGELAGMLEAAGAIPVMVPAIRILPPENWGPTDSALRSVGEYDWIVFTSVNGVAGFTDRATSQGVGPEHFPANVGAIGPGTARALEAYGLQVTWMPSSFTSATLGDRLPEPPAKVLLVRADVATEELDHKLGARGFEVDRIDAYRTAPGETQQIREAYRECDAVALTSASIAQSFASAVSGHERTVVVCSIGPATSAACRRRGVQVDTEAAEHTMPGLVRALREYYGCRA
ncbi:MAG: uroporphyrinogen-III synthase [Actinomycetota bacterium]